MVGKTSLSGILISALSGLAFVSGPSFPSAAEAASGCDALASEQVTLNAGAPYRTGAVPLAAGERLYLRIAEASDRAGAGSVALIEAGETEAVLLSGEPPAEAVFAAPYDGLYSFEYRASGAASIHFSVRCHAQSASPGVSSLSPESFTERRTARLLADDTAQASLNRRAAKPESIDQAVKSSATLGDEGDPRQVTVSTSLQNLAAAEGRVFADSKLDIWIEGKVAQSEQRFEEDGLRHDAEGSAGVFNLGGDYLLRPGLLVGAMMQLESYREDYDALNAFNDSKGMLFGPYASLRLAPDLVFDARAAWGDTENDSKLPDGTRLAYDTNRQLIRGQLTGNRDIFGLQLTPSIALALVEDRFADPADLSEDAVDDGGSVIGRLGVGSALSYRIALEDGGFMQPSASLSTGWTLDSLDTIAADGAGFANEAGLKAEAGLMLGTANGVSIEASGAIEGLGMEDYSAWSGRLSLTAPLN